MPNAMIIEITVGPTLANLMATMPYLKNAISAATMPPAMPPSRSRRVRGAVGECCCGCGGVEEGAGRYGFDPGSGCHVYVVGGGGGWSPSRGGSNVAIVTR